MKTARLQPTLFSYMMNELRLWNDELIGFIESVKKDVTSKTLYQKHSSSNPSRKPVSYSYMIMGYRRVITTYYKNRVDHKLKVNFSQAKPYIDRWTDFTLSMTPTGREFLKSQKN